MDWLPADADYLTVLAGVFAALTSALGIIVAISQLSGAARAKRTIDWTTTALVTERDPARRAELGRMKLASQGYLVAAAQVPWWRFTEAAVWMLLAPGMVVVAPTREGIRSFASLIAFATVTITLVLRRAIRLYSERLRVAHEFTVGGRPIKKAEVDALNLMEGGKRSEFVLALVCGLALAAVGAVVAVGLNQGGNAWGWLFAAVPACWGAFDLTHIRVKAWATREPADRRLDSSADN